MTMRILLISKTPKTASLSDEDLARLEHSGAANAEQLRHAASEHGQSLESVRSDLLGHDVLDRRVSEISEEDLSGRDLIVTVGGDGTVLAACGLITDTPMLCVNSDPSRSIGNYTRCNRDAFRQLFQDFLQQQHVIERIPRLRLEINDTPEPHLILNDCLFTNQNPAAMTRYTINVDGEQEQQFSSGVWISTGAGSTGAIHSAGMDAVDAHQSALLFKVREAFLRHGAIRLTEGCQMPPRGLELCTAIPGINLYIDGAHRCKKLQPGSTVRFFASPSPLQLVTRSS